LARRLCVLRVAIDVQGLTFLRLYRDDDERFRFIWSTPEFQPEEIAETAAILDCLVRGSLVQRQYDPKKCVDEFSMHRVIVEFLERQLGEARSGLLGSVYQFYRSGRTVENPKTLEDLQPLLEAQYFAFQLGNYSEAKDLIYELEDYLEPWGYWSLLRDLIVQLLPKLDRASQPTFMGRIGIRYREWGDWDEAEKWFKKSLVLRTELEDRSGMATSWGLLGDIERNRGNWDEAERLYRQSLEIETELGDRSGMASSWGVLGYIENLRGNWDEAERLYRQKLETCEELGDRSGMAAVIGTLGDIERKRGNWDEAERLFHQCLEMTTELGDRSGMATSWSVLGDIAWERENWDEAEDLYRKCLALKTELGELRGVAFSHEDLAKVETHKGNPDRAQRHYTIARDLYTQLGATKDLDRIQTEFNPQ
jgi:tetratricopeptide (TPR) repeat protein